MCILIVAIDRRRGARVPVVIAHLRDENLRRPVLPPSFVPDTALFGPRDAEAGGSWFLWGVESGIAAVLTNFRSISPTPLGVVSRGLLVTRTAEGNLKIPPPLHPFQKVVTHSKPYEESIGVELGQPSAGFNLLRVAVGKEVSARLVSNRAPKEHLPHGLERMFEDSRGFVSVGPEEAVVTGELSDGVHVLSNSILNDISWPKAKWLQSEASSVLSSVLSDEQVSSSTSKLERTTLVGEVVAALEPLFFVPKVKEEEGGEGTKASSFPWSPLPAWSEKTLQEGPFVLNWNTYNLPIPYFPAYGSRALTMLVVADGVPHFFSKSFEDAQFGREIQTNGSRVESEEIGASWGALEDDTSQLERLQHLLDKHCPSTPSSYAHSIPKNAIQATWKQKTLPTPLSPPTNERK